MGISQEQMVEQLMEDVVGPVHDGDMSIAEAKDTVTNIVANFAGGELDDDPGPGEGEPKEPEEPEDPTT